MNWKKFLLIALAVGALAFAATPRADAGISVGIGFGYPAGYRSYDYGYPAYYPYGYNYYADYGPRRCYSPRRVVYFAPRHYWRPQVRRAHHRHRNWR